MNLGKTVASDLKYIISEIKPELEMFEGKTILLTGAAGFIGYYLCLTVYLWNQEKIKNKPIKLIMMDNFKRGLPKWIKGLAKEPNFVLIKHDAIKKLPKSLPIINYFIHAASIASPVFYRKYPLETMDVNVQGLRNILDYGTEHKKDLLGCLFFSSSEIYGNPPSNVIPTPETFFGLVSCTGPRSCYDESKRYGETLCMTFFRQKRIPVTIVRPFNNYGPGLKLTDGRVISDFFQCVLNDQSIKLFSDGSPTRTFCYIADAVIGYWKALAIGKRGEAYNIGSRTPEISINKLAKLILITAKNEMGYAKPIQYKSHPDDAYLTDVPMRRCPDLTKAFKDLHYHPKITLEYGIRQTLLWYLEEREANI